MSCINAHATEIELQRAKDVLSSFLMHFDNTSALSSKFPKYLIESGGASILSSGVEERDYLSVYIRNTSTRQVCMEIKTNWRSFSQTSNLSHLSYLGAMPLHYTPHSSVFQRPCQVLAFHPPRVVKRGPMCANKVIVILTYPVAFLKFGNITVVSNFAHSILGFYDAFQLFLNFCI